MKNMLFKVMAICSAWLPLMLGAAFDGSAFSGKLDELSWEGSWQTAENGMTLNVTIDNQGKSAGGMVFDFPSEPVPFRKEFRCPPGKSTFPVTFPAGNPKNRYQISCDVTYGRQTLNTPLILTGDQVNPLLQRTPEMAKPNKRFGVCTHFTFGKNLGQWGEVWNDYKSIIATLKECNISIIREDLGTVKDPKTGVYKLDPWTENWVNYAQSQGITVVGIVELNSNRSQEEFVQLCTDIGKGYPQLKYIELGNEPQNFGDWIKNHGGDWNGKSTVGKPAPWVDAVRKYSNAAAEALRKVRPDIVILGMGALPPNVLRALEAGVSPAITGIVDHPYGYSLTPENVPWGEGFVKRDGIASGDARNTFYGFAQKLGEAFQKSGTPRTLWLTEWGYPTTRLHPGKATNIYTPHTEDAQAAYILRRLLEQLRLGELLGGSFIYDYKDDGYLTRQNWEHFEPEANFGLLRHDMSKKPAWYVLQRFNTLLAHATPSSEIEVKSANCNIHPAMKDTQQANWDDVTVTPDQGVRTLPLIIPDGDKPQLALAVWNLRRYDGEFAPGGLNLRFTGKIKIPPADQPFVMLDLITGRSFDAPWKHTDGLIEIENIAAGNHPLLLLLGPAEK